MLYTKATHVLRKQNAHTVLAVEPCSLDGAQEELGAVGVGTSVGHAVMGLCGMSMKRMRVMHMHVRQSRHLPQNARAGVLELEAVQGEE